MVEPGVKPSLQPGLVEQARLVRLFCNSTIIQLYSIYCIFRFFVSIYLEYLFISSCHQHTMSDPFYVKVSLAKKCKLNGN